MWNTKINIANCKTRKSSLGVILGRLISNHVDLWKMVCAIYCECHLYVCGCCEPILNGKRKMRVSEKFSVFNVICIAVFMSNMIGKLFSVFYSLLFLYFISAQKLVHLMLVFSNKIRHKITRAQKSSREEIERILCSFSHHSNMPSLIIL